MWCGAEAEDVPWELSQCWVVGSIGLGENEGAEESGSLRVLAHGR